MDRLLLLSALATAVAVDDAAPRPSRAPLPTTLVPWGSPLAAPTAPCTWGGRAHALDWNLTTSVPGSRQCFPNLFAADQPLEFPYPRSSYNYDLDPPVVGPRVQVQWTNGVTNVTAPVAAFDYRTFEMTGDELLFHALPDAPGVYRLAVQAFDWDRASSECRACLAVTDQVRPRATVARAGLCGASTTAPYSPEALAAADDRVRALVRYRATATNNDACSDRRCDAVTVAQTGFLSAFPTAVVDGANAAVDAVPDGWLGCLAAPLSARERQRLTTPLALVDDARDYFVALQELYTPFRCGAPPGRPTCAGAASETCALMQAVVLPASHLVARVAVKLKATAGHIADPAAAFPGAGYLPPSARHLHLAIPCYPTNASFSSFCADTVEWRVSDLFELSAELNASQPWGFDAAAPLVTWFVQQGPAWVAVADNKRLAFDKFQDTLVFRAMTPCGQVGEDIAWTVFSHRAEALSVDAWWNSLWSCGGCNVPKADFSVCRFRFDPTSPLVSAMLHPPASCRDAAGRSCRNGCLARGQCNGRSTAASCGQQAGATWCDARGSALLAAAVPRYSLRSLQCVWQYANTSSANWSVAVDVAVDTAFALKLRNADATELSVSCTLTFDPDTGEPAVVKTRSLALSLRNCDGPRFEDHALAFVKDRCDASWRPGVGRQPAPRQACAGHLVFPSTTDAAATVLLTPADDLACCSGPVAAFSCQPLPGHPGLKQCQRADTATALLAAEPQAWPPVALAASLALVFVLVRRRRQPSDTDLSRPLIDGDRC
uniref:Secreted protein n=1 Tax=Achlya hypogyna TaxID=1202772 RepID=A0A0A7CN15_ACHHY|nr:secreted protein [Achlya hypogyna]